MPGFRVERGQTAGAPASRSTISPTPRATLVAMLLLALQRTAGNTAVAHLVNASSAISIQRDGGHAVASSGADTALDDRARAIIDAAHGTHGTAGERAMNAVRQIVNTYYADRASLVSAVTYASAERGLLTTSVGHGASSTGSIAVGDYFVAHIADFARRVLQVGHELEHIQQYRGGLGGGTHRHERELLAFYHEGTAGVVPHTGRMAHATRVDLLDEAIRHYNAFSDADKTRYADQYRDLLEQRNRHQRASGWHPTAPPTDAAP